MVTKYKLYLFDLDGTLLDSDKMLIESFRTLYKLYKPDFECNDSYILEFSGPPIRESLMHEFPDQDVDFMLKEWQKYSVTNYEKYTRLFKGAKELLKSLEEKGIKFGIITNKSRKATDFSFKLTGIDDMNLFSICADEMEHLKPAPDSVFKAMKYFGIEDKSEVLYIGDTDFDYFTAKNAGVNFGFVSWSPRALPKDAKVDVLIKDFESWSKDIK